MRNIRAILKIWIVFAAMITLVCGLVYVTIQQTLRIGANDPQIQIAEDAARALEGGGTVESVLPAGTIDLAASLSPYLIVFDQNGSPLASNARLNGSIPALPAGVLDYTKQHGEDRITWQPQPGLRSATVIVPVAGSQAGFVLAGRSLREVEKRVNLLSLQVSAAWLVSMPASLVLVALLEVVPWFRG